MTHPAGGPICPICKSEVKLLDRTGDFTGYDCGEHGRFRVAGSVFATPSLIGASRKKWEAALVSVKKRDPDAWAPLITSDDL
jgi:hypothetical protein